MKDKVKGLIIGITIGSMLTGVSAYAASGTSIKAVMQKVNLYVDGKKQTTTSAITYKNTTYVPVRTMSNAVSKDVSLKGDNLYVGKQPTVKQITENEALSFVVDYFKKTEKVKFKVIYMMDSQDDNYYYVGAYEDFPERVLIYKWYKVHKVTGTVTHQKVEY
ncbi:stalk domain-containing protein [Paenibacillus lautus]|uniref:stalk domain-containing protein n=1 Tax=Paenibacillus lautus TaxID=1401 RepID=UPI001C7D1DE2|nr:stalk domain-containing protein [Paenibacillus lautus]MBX4152393.1 hypothetical protein [Paenibacillus lautus]